MYLLDTNICINFMKNAIRSLHSGSFPTVLPNF